MDKQEALAKVKEIGLLAVIRGPSAELTVKMVQALVAGGVTGIEVTYSTPNAPWVEVWLSPHTMVMPGWVRPNSGPITCTMPLRSLAGP